jgi:hypothetical protein
VSRIPAKLCSGFELCHVGNPHNLVRHKIMHHVPGLGYEHEGGVRHHLLQPNRLFAVDDLVFASGDDRSGANLPSAAGA